MKMVLSSSNRGIKISLALLIISTAAAFSVNYMSSTTPKKISKRKRVSKFIINNSSFVRNGLIGAMVKARTGLAREPLLETPADHGLEFESIDINSSDGIRLSAWFVPSKEESTKLVIINHPLKCNRYGTNNGMDGVEVRFLPMVKALAEAGYNVITYDQRGQGESDGNLGKNKLGDKDAPVGMSAFEHQDMIGVLNYVSSHDTYSKYNVGLVLQCMGANAGMKAWALEPGAFENANVKALVAIQPYIHKGMVGRMTELLLGVDLCDAMDKKFEEDFGLVGVDATKYVGAVTVPTLFVQVRQDVSTGDEKRHDVEDILDACKVEKEMLWVGPGTENEFGDGKRFDGYNYFPQKPAQLIEFLNAKV